jgi:hypothetical protein
VKEEEFLNFAKTHQEMLKKRHGYELPEEQEAEEDTK